MFSPLWRPFDLASFLLALYLETCGGLEATLAICVCGGATVRAPALVPELWGSHVAALWLLGGWVCLAELPGHVRMPKKTVSLLDGHFCWSRQAVGRWGVSPDTLGTHQLFDTRAHVETHVNRGAGSKARWR